MVTGFNISEAFWLILITFVVAILTRRAKLPYALFLVVTGLGVGALRLLPRVHLDPSVLLMVFLPPLLFESALNLRVDALRRDWKPIALFTIAGTVISTFVVGGLASRILSLSLPVALVFGALISTTDPISVVGVFRRLGAGKRLTLLIEAESLFNNDTAYVLFTIVLGTVAGGRASAWSGIGQFLQLAGGGALLGVAVGLIASRVHYEIDDYLVEITLSTIVAFGSYLGAQAIHVSGVMAVITSGIVVANYGMQRAMSPSTQLALTAFWEYLGFLVNSVVFVLIGIEVCSLNWHREWPVALAAALIVLAGRAGIYPLSVLVNRFGGNVPRSWQHVLFWGGLRGSLSMALVLSLPAAFPDRETLIAATFGAVIFSLLVQGMTLGPLIRHLNLCSPAAKETADQRRLAGEIVAIRAAINELERLRKLETHPTWSIEFLLQDYRRRLAAAEETMDRLKPELKHELEKRAIETRRLTLTAEKNAWQESERQGWLEEEDWLDITQRIDAELANLAAEGAQSAD